MEILNIIYRFACNYKFNNVKCYMKLSVVVTAYNVEQYINECIESVKTQIIDDANTIEIIVVEDKSTDDTLKFLKKIKDIKIISNKINIGAGLSRRIGIEAATGEYVMLLDGDDYLENKNYLNTLINKAIESDADVISGGIKIIREDKSSDITSYGNCTCTGYDKISKFWGKRVVFMVNKIIRKTMYDKIPYCHRRYIEDTPVIVPILWYANKVEYVDTVGYVYRMRKDSLTHNTNIVKDVIFKGLCWCDLMEFFNANDKEAFNHIKVKDYIQNTINVLNNIVLTPQAIQPYANEFAELMMRLINLVQINSINFKEINNGKV